MREIRSSLLIPVTEYTGRGVRKRVTEVLGGGLILDGRQAGSNPRLARCARQKCLTLGFSRLPPAAQRRKISSQFPRPHRMGERAFPADQHRVERMLPRFQRDPSLESINGVSLAAQASTPECHPFPYALEDLAECAGDRRL